jgi:hypothetical protein
MPGSMTGSSSPRVFGDLCSPGPWRLFGGGWRLCLGSAHDEVELAALKAAAAARLAVGQTELDLGLIEGVEPGTLPITSSRMSHLWAPTQLNVE